MKNIRLATLTDERLLNLRLSDLPVHLEGTRVEKNVRRLYRELEERQIQFLPHVWISTEFYTPDGVPGFAVPFYLMHPRLVKLERKQMLEVEGGNQRELMRILRHEAGHALGNAYRVHSKKSWREVFGSVKQSYPTSYKPKPNSRKYVLHLDAWYAQSHPLEDWAETFAVWLRARSRWRSQYQNWPALQKLEYVDELMKSLAGRPPLIRTRRVDEPLSKLHFTLKQYYRRKRRRYSLRYPNFYDRDLRRIFSDDPRYSIWPAAASFLRRYRNEFAKTVSRGTGVHAYTVYHVLDNIMDRAKELKLHLCSSEKFSRQEALILVTVHTMNIVHSGRYRFHFGM